MATRVRRKGRDPHDDLYVLETDSTGTSALVVPAADYVPGRRAGDYDPELLVQIDTDELGDATAPALVWAVCQDSGRHGPHRLGPWMDRADADAELERMSFRGFESLFLQSSEDVSE